jgi:hypothetical protein
LVAAVAVGVASLSPFATRAARAQPPHEVVYWQEGFDRPSLDFVDPFNHNTTLLQRVYSVVHEGDGSFLHALHDETGAHLPAMHYGRAFQTNPPPLDKVTALRWRWRVLRHPSVKSDPWEDVAASVYVIMQTPTVFRGGRGFKFGWLAKPGPDNTTQHGILQLPLRHDPAGPEWHAESVDLCALYRAHFGACEGQHVLYVGVVTDADGTKSVSEADYGSFELVGVP